jgi:molybdopterin/thiamine biosynthesis adenylyltransferase
VGIEHTCFVVIGAGGLGCPALLGLRAAGAKQVLVVDHDRVEASNLHRQVLYDLGDVGAAKAVVAARELARAGIDARPRVQRLAPEEVPGLVAELAPDSVVLECTDAPALKFATNDACVARLGTAVGTAGWLQAVLAVQLATGALADDVVGRLHELDLARGTIRTLGGRARAGCPACAARAPHRPAAHAAPP